MQRARQREQVHLGVSHFEPRPTLVSGVGRRTLAMEGIIILILAATVVQQSKEFHHPDIRTDLGRKQPPVMQDTQPVITAMEAAMSQQMACGQKLEEFCGDSGRGDEWVTHSILVFVNLFQSLDV